MQNETWTDLRQDDNTRDRTQILDNIPGYMRLVIRSATCSIYADFLFTFPLDEPPKQLLVNDSTHSSTGVRTGDSNHKSVRNPLAIFPIPVHE